jgi:uncharacterized protein
MKLRQIASRISVAFAFAIAGTALTSGAALASPSKAIPAPPRYYVLDEPHLLNDRALKSLEGLLIEHDRATGEQIVVAIFNSLEGEDLNDYTNRVFQKWQIGQQGEDNGVLFAIFYQDHKTRIEVGYGLEPVLTDAKSSRILRDILVPGMKANQPAEAITQATMQILQVIDSPLIPNGRAQQILKSGGLLRYNIQGSASSANIWWVWFFLGFILLTIVSHIMSSAEAHFTRAGWYRPRPWRKRWDKPGGSGGLGGGGFFGGWGPGAGGGGWGSGGGDGGGFSGGGGRSGGGGASAGW